MDVKMEDVSKGSETNEGAPVVTEAPTIGVLDGWIDSLMNCKQLSETDVQRLCDKVWMAQLMPVDYRTRRTKVLMTGT